LDETATLFAKAFHRAAGVNRLWRINANQPDYFRRTYIKSTGC
jgi:hypothetical protein